MQIIEQYKSMSGKFVYRVVIDETESAFFQYSEEPSTAQLEKDVQIRILQKQLAELTNQPVEEPSEGVAVVTPRQFRLALLEVGLYEQVLELMAQMPTELQIDWEYAIEIRRDYPAWNEMAAMLGKTPADVDAVFQLGATFV